MKKNVRIFNEGNFTRMCVSCGAKRHKNEMLRIALSPEGKVYLDETGRGQGRGCYVCRDENCIAAAAKSGRAARSLKCDIPAEIYDMLKQKAEEPNE